jgi:hypothetical protein
MKKIYLFIFTCFSFHFIIAQTLPSTVYFKNGLPASSANLLSKKLNNSALRNIQFRDKFYALAQFEKNPDAVQKKDLADLGIYLFDFLGGKSWLIEIRNQEAFSRARNAGVVALSYINTRSKLAKNLNEYVSGKNEVIAINYFGDFPPGIVEQEVANAGAQIVHYKIQPQRTLFVHAIPTVLEKVAALPFVSFISRQSLNLQPLNYNNRAIHGVNALSAMDGRNLQGNQVTIGMGDNADPSTHIDFSGRLILRNSLTPVNHGTHTTGTAAGAGILNPKYKGMAPKAKIVSQEYNDIIFNAPVFIADYNLVLTNNSYYQGADFCAGDGEYDAFSNYADAQLLANPSLQHVFAAGNDGFLTCSPYPNPYATIKSGYQVAKNVLTVGAMDNMTYGIKASSSRGPVADGRLKPEIVAGGENITSTYTYNTYGTTSGTSMASPTVTGILALLYERYRQLHGGANPEASLIKVLTCNNADDLGNPGPDYSFGFGMINGRAAVEAMENNQYFTGLLSGGDSLLFSLPAQPAGNYQVKIMLYWPDQPGAAFAQNALVNDLDLSVMSPDAATHLPLILNDSPEYVNNNAVEGIDHLNNIEQVVINNPPAGAYTIKVKGTNIPFGNQRFFISYQIIKPSVTVEYPFGNNTLVPGETEYIRWTAYGSNTNNFTVEYSPDNGATWSTINNNVPSSARLLAWTVPSTPTNQGLVRVTRNNAGYVDLSDFPFTILGQPQVTLTNPCPGYAQLVWNPIPSASLYEIMILKGDSMQAIATTTDTTYLLDGLNKDSSYWLGIRAINNGFAGRRSISKNIIPSGGPCSLSLFDNDFSCDSILIPITGRQFTSSALSSANIKVRVKNLGSVAASGSFNISYQVNAGAIVTESTTQNIAAGASYIYAFTTAFDFSAAGTYNIAVWVSHPGDGNHKNDSLFATIKNLSNDPIVLNPSFTEDFESAVPQAYLSNATGLNGLDRFDFSSIPNGRMRTFINSGFARSGKFCATLDQANITAPLTADSLIATFNLSNYSATDQIWLDYFYKKQMLAFSHAAGIWIRGSDQQPWILADSIDSNAVFPSVYSAGKNIDVSGLLKAGSPGQTISSSFQVKFSWNGYGQANDVNPIGYSDAGISFDDIILTRAQNDVGLQNLVQPNLGNVCGFSNSETIQVQVKNYTVSTLNNIAISYSLNGNVVTETIPALGGNQSTTYSFLQKADLSAFQDYDLRVWVSYPGDNYHRNDSLPEMHFHTVPLVSAFPYLEGFENNNGNWYTQGINDNWQWGTPQKNIISGAANGHNAWVTGLSGNYSDNQLSYLYSPCFDLSSMNRPVLSFSHIFQTEDDCACDYHWVEYSTDNVTWKVLDTTAGGINWYDDNTTHAWQKSDTIWHVSSHDIPVKSSTFRLRFVMSSDPAVNYEGVAIDDVHIFDKAPIEDSVPAMISLSQPVSGNNWVHFDLNGKRMASINPQGQDLGNVLLKVFLYPGAVRDTNNQYYLNRNMVISPSVQPSSYVTVRYYFLDSEANELIKASGCAACTGIHDAYQSGVTEYSTSDSLEEDSTLQNNIKGAYSFSKPRQDVSIIPYDNGYYAEYIVYSFSEFWINGGGISKDQPLPYMLDSFSATRMDTTGLLQWKLFPGSVVDSFVIEKGSDPTHFNEIIGSVHGISNVTDYQFVDLHLHQGLNYYRIRIVTPSGNIQYSPVRVITYVINIPNLGVFPNPVRNGLLFVNTSTDCTGLQLFDVLGSLIRSEEKTGSQNTFSVANISKGVYILKIFTVSGNSVVKILVE